MSQQTLMGLWPSLATIVMSEAGDKTFFLAMMLSLRKGRSLALTSAMTALAAMTVISTALGQVVRGFPTFVQEGQAVITWASAILFLIFGAQSLREAQIARRDGDSLAEAQNEAEQEVQDVVSTFAAPRTNWKEWWQCASMIFLAEWGDRSMLATVALSVVMDPLGVVVGAILGHFLATSLAVFGGELLSKFMDEVTAKTVGGILFLIFAVTTVIGVY